MDISKIMQMATQLQSQLTQAQEKAAHERVTGEAGGGLVKIVMNGKHEVQEVTIDPSAVDPEDVKLLEDLVRAAVNQASSKVATDIQSKLGNLAGDMGIDLSTLGLGNLGK